MNNRKKLIITSFIIILLLFIGISYAYFSSNIIGSESASTVYANGGILEIEYSDGNGYLNASGIYPKNDAWITKTITLTGKNTTDLKMYYGIKIVVDNSSFSSGAITYSLVGENISNNGETVTDISDAPIDDTLEVGRGYFTNGKNLVHKYTLNIYFLETEKDQSGDMKKTFNAHIEITEEEANNRKMVAVNFDANGGKTPINKKQVEENATYGTLPTPIREGYTFLGWRRKNLSDKYQTVEYIESTGEEYINTGVIPTNITGIYGKLSSSNISSDLVYFGSRSTTDGRFWVGNNRSQVYYGWNTVVTRTTNITSNTVNIIKMNYLNDRKALFNDEIVRNIGSTQLASNTQPIYLFAGNDNGNLKYNSSIKLYEFQISDGNDIIHNYIPCYRKSDGAIGLYDLVSGVFYTNSGTGTFRKGQDIDYIQTSDEALIITSDTDLISNEDHTLYAVWGHNAVVTFDANGGTVNPGTKTYNYNSNYGELPIPTRSGYTFVGWKSRNDDYILSSGYQELEYIESTGSQYINTGVNPTNTTGIYSKLSTSDTTSDLVYFGSRYSGNRFWIANQNNQIYYGWNSNTYRTTSITANTIFEASLNYLNNRKEMFNSEVVSNISETLGTNSNSIYIFAANDGSLKYNSKIKLYVFKISNNDEIIHDYIPCYRKSDNVIGLYDLVGGGFYINSGTGALTTGNNVYAITSSAQLITNEDHTLYAVWEEE